MSFLNTVPPPPEGFTIPKIIPLVSLQEYEESRIKRANEIKGSLTGYNCEKCLNRGYFTKLDSEHNEVISECDCMVIRRNYAAIQQSGLSDVINKYTFQSYICSEKWQEECKTIAADYCANSSDQWLAMLGQSGSGKTHLCTAVSTYYMKHSRVLKYLLWSDINSKLDSMRFKDESRQEYMDFIRNTDIVYIDDFLKTSCNENGLIRPPSNEIKNAYDVINARYNANKKTIISSELFLTEIKQIDVAVAGRIKQMCEKYVVSISADDSRNYRIKGATP